MSNKLGGNRALHLQFGDEEIAVWDDGRIQWGLSHVATTATDVRLLLQSIFEAGRKEAQAEMRAALGITPAQTNKGEGCAAGEDKQARATPSAPISTDTKDTTK